MNRDLLSACLQNETAPKSLNFKTKNGPKNDPKLPRIILSLVLLCRISHRHYSKIFHREFPHKIKYLFTTRICRHGHANRDLLSGKRKAHKHSHFGPVGFGTALVCPRDKPGLSQGQTWLIPGTSPGSLLILQWKPSLSQGQTHFVSGTNRTKGGINSLCVNCLWAFFARYLGSKIPLGNTIGRSRW